VFGLRPGDDRAHVALPRRFVAVLFVFLLAAGAAHAEWSASVEYQRFKWTEPSVGVRETGPLMGLGLGWTEEKPSGWALAWRGKYYFGSVDYNGATLVGGQPVTGSVDYDGLYNEVRLSHPLERSGRLHGAAGLGLDYWNRQLTATQREEWYVYFLRAGVEWGNPRREGFFVGGGVKYPLYVVQDPHAKSIGFDQDVKLHPKGKLSLYADLGYRVSRDFTVSAFYDSYRFDQSSAVNVSGDTCVASFGTPNCRLLQPASNADMYGIRLTLHF